MRFHVVDNIDIVVHGVLSGFAQRILGEQELHLGNTEMTTFREAEHDGGRP